MHQGGLCTEVLPSRTGAAGAANGCGPPRSGPGDAALPALHASGTLELGETVQGAAHAQSAFASAFTDAGTSGQPPHAQRPP